MMWLFGALPATEAKSFLSCTRSGVQHRSQVSELFLVVLFISSGREDLWTVVCILCFFCTCWNDVNEPLLLWWPLLRWTFISVCFFSLFASACNTCTLNQSQSCHQHQQYFHTRGRGSWEQPLKLSFCFSFVCSDWTDEGAYYEPITGKHNAILLGSSF